MTDDDTEEDVSLARRIPWRRLANIVGLVLVLAVVVPFLVYAVPQVVGAEHSYVVLSGSMQPVMSPGDAIIVNDVPASEIETGDVISFTQGNAERPTTHRVIEVVEQDGEPAFRTQGDAVDVTDGSLVTPGDLEGKVMSVGGYLFVIPLVGHVILFASTTEGLVALLVVPLSLLVISEIWDVVAAASGGGGDAAADGEDDGSEGDGGDDATAVTADAKADTGDSDDGKTILDPEANGEVATAEELARRVEERPGAFDASATDDADTVAAAIEGKEPETSEMVDGEDGSEADEEAASEKEGSSEAAGEEPEGLVFSAAELQLGLVVLVAFFAYSAWVAYATFFEVWAFAVAASVAAALLLLGGLYVVGGEAESTANTSQDEHEQEQTGAEDPGEADSGESGPAPNRSDGSTGAATKMSGTDTDANPAVDADELLSLTAADEVDSQRLGLDLSGTDGAVDSGGDGDGQGTDAVDPSEVGNDD